MNRRKFLQLFGGAAVATVTAATIVSASKNNPEQDMKPYPASDAYISIGTGGPIYSIEGRATGSLYNLVGGTVVFF